MKKITFCKYTWKLTVTVSKQKIRGAKPLIMMMMMMMSLAIKSPYKKNEFMHAFLAVCN